MCWCVCCMPLYAHFVLPCSYLQSVATWRIASLSCTALHNCQSHTWPDKLSYRSSAHGKVLGWTSNRKDGVSQNCWRSWSTRSDTDVPILCKDGSSQYQAIRKYQTRAFLFLQLNHELLSQWKTLLLHGITQFCLLWGLNLDVHADTSNSHYSSYYSLPIFTQDRHPPRLSKRRHGQMGFLNL